MNNLSKAVNTIKQGFKSKKLSILVEKSTLLLSIAKALESVGCIRSFAIHGDKLELCLKYKGNKPLYRTIEQVSKGTRRTYVKERWFKNKLDKSAIYIISTSKGVQVHTFFSTNKRVSFSGELLLKLM